MPKYLAGAVMLLLCSALSFAQILEPTHTQRQEKAVTQQIKKAVNKQMAQEAIKQHQERHCYYCKNKITETGDPHLYCPAQTKMFRKTLRTTCQFRPQLYRPRSE